jgi:signal transduction histidine kinase
LDRRTFRSRVARRVFLVFTICALLPVSAFAVFSLLQVSRQLEEEAHVRLRSESKAVGMALLDRLVAFETSLAAAPAAGHADDGVPATRRRTWWTSVADVPPALAEILPFLAPRSPEERQHLASGRSLLRVLPTPGSGAARLFLVRVDGDAADSPVWVAELDGEWIWRPDALREDVHVVVRDAEGRLLFASSPEAARARSLGPGDAVEIDGEAHLSDAWTLFLGAMYASPAWTIQHLQPESAVWAPLAEFRRAFLLVALLSAGMILFLSIGLIRRSLVPIDALRAATERLGAGRFDVHLEITSGDEFQDLGDAFNHMTARIRDLTNNLEDQVAARTRALEDTLRELRETQAQLVHQEKMASIGQFVAGIAHEMNNPLAFVEGNLHFLRQYTETLVEALAAYEQEVRAGDPSLYERLETLREKLELGYVIEDLESVFDGCADGVQRTTGLVHDLRTFSRLDDGARGELHLAEALDSTLNVLSGRLAGVQVTRDYADVPPVECLASQINQVFLNLVSNAVDAVEGEGHIWLRTRDLGDGRVCVEVEDDGCGMDESVAARVFEPFYTTKEVGRGTGLGLSVSFGIVERHAGRISVESERGRGSCFRVELPIRYVGAGEGVEAASR